MARDQPNPNKTRPKLFLAIVAIIVGFLAAFLILRPRPAGSGVQTQNPAAAH
jgi:hypothetical protein